MILHKLSAHFPANAISWRCGPTNSDKTKGMALAYIDARDVMARLDEVCGPLWQSEYVPMPNGTCCCRIGILVGNEWVWRSSGAVNIADSEKADAKEMAEKGSYSDAFKRAAVMWGIGRYLYDLPSPWVEIDGRKQITEQGLANLQARLREFSKRNSQAPLPAPVPAPAPAPAPATEVMDPQTGELTPPADVVREVIKAHEPAPVAPVAPVAPTEPEPATGGRPSYIPPGGKVLTAEQKRERAAKEAAEAKQKHEDESRATVDAWVEELREICAAAKDPHVSTHTVTSSFQVWEQTRKATWSKITPKDQARVKDKLRQAQDFVAKRRASAA